MTSFQISTPPSSRWSSASPACSMTEPTVIPWRRQKAVRECPPQSCRRASLRHFNAARDTRNAILASLGIPFTADEGNALRQRRDRPPRWRHDAHERQRQRGSSTPTSGSKPMTTYTVRTPPSGHSSPLPIRLCRWSPLVSYCLSGCFSRPPHIGGQPLAGSLSFAPRISS